MGIKAAFKQLCPPLLTPLARTLSQRLGSGDRNLRGDFATWAEAHAHSTGYDGAQILERVLHATRTVKQGGGIFERDSIVFQAAVPPYPLLFGLSSSASFAEGSLRVLDFGGSLGSSYALCRPYLKNIPHVHWSVVEQAHYVEAGRKEFADEELRFYDSIDAAATHEKPHVVLLSGVLQYLERPYEVLAQLAQLKIPIIIDRTPWSDDANDHFTVQVVPASIFEAQLPFRIFGRDKLRDALTPSLQCLASFQTVDPDMECGNRLVKFGGWIYMPVEG